ncbi:MAG: type II secretion system F family protein [Candidatus Omnitrophica bacterium]|nr:type II secretion system F family protein [Candidatus Omnitrophota bacterium]
MILLVIIPILVGLSVYLVMYQLKVIADERPRLSPEAMMDLNPYSPALSRSNPTVTMVSSFNRRMRSWDAKLPKLTFISKRLMRAGNPMGVAEFLLFTVLAALFTPVLSFIFLGNIMAKDTLLMVSIGLGILIPQLWLNGRISKRQSSIRKELPMIIDLLNLCVSGGMDFMLAVNRVVKDLRQSDLTRELAEVYRQTQMGKGRAEALRNLAARVDMQEMHSFARTLIQADRMGSSIAEALRIQSEEIKTKRFQRGESMALKAPIKLLFPLFFFILPAVIVIIGGPIMLQFTRTKIGF